MADFLIITSSVLRSRGQQSQNQFEEPEPSLAVPAPRFRSREVFQPIFYSFFLKICCCATLKKQFYYLLQLPILISPAEKIFRKCFASHFIVFIKVRILDRSRSLNIGDQGKSCAGIILGSATLLFSAISDLKTPLRNPTDCHLFYK